MSWSNLFTIFRREVRDQIRDRRTLFMIFVLPLLLYPLLGIGVIQFTLLLQQKPKTVALIGGESLPKEPRLLTETGDRFNPSLFDNPDEAGIMAVQQEKAGGPWDDPGYRQAAVRERLVDAVIEIPRDIRAQLEKEKDVDIRIDYRSVDEPSQITYLRLKEVIDRWKKSIVAKRLVRDNRSEGYTEPVHTKGVDVATAAEVGGNVWGRLFPFLLVMMALTGAFYPAVDLCAGEKERGTMETLLISPATRTEIVLGKFLTVMMASVTTAVLNLVSMGLTGLQLAMRVGAAGGGGGGDRGPGIHAFAPPTLQSAVWMALLLIPLAALFSAVCVALAVLARSMKEGQYYMTPLYMVALPLIFLTLTPGIELNLLFSMVPITGVALLLRALIVGDYGTALKFSIPVLLPTILYAAIALRWAIDQFQREDVLFREAERFSLGSYFRHLIRDRPMTPTASSAVLCFALIVAASWSLIQFQPLIFGTSEKITPASIVAFQLMIAAPPLILAFLFTGSPSRTLRLRMPAPRYLVLAALLPFTLNPLVGTLAWAVDWLFPLAPATKELLKKAMFDTPGLLGSLATFALLPALCEEVAFRGYILSGLEDRRHARSAIVLSALMFGILHVLLSLFQQLFNSTLLGIVLGLLAVRSRSLLPGILFHFLNNGIAVATGHWMKTTSYRAVAPWIYRDTAEGLFRTEWVVASAILSAALVYALWKSDRPGHEPLLEPGFEPGPPEGPA